MSSEELLALQRRAERERLARKQAEKLLEEKSLALYQSNQKLQSLAAALEDQVQERTQALAKALSVAEHAARAKSEFLAMMSHEIRTPLNGIIGTAQVIQMAECLDDEQRELVEVIKRSGDSLLVIINDILDFSKIEAGRLELDPQSVPIRSEIQNLTALYAATADANSLKLMIDLDHALPSTVVVDWTRLRQVISNLLSNAIKFTHAGSVSLQVRWEASEKLSVAVVDSGIGISTEGLDRIFKPFSQVDSSTARKYGGTGLGLVICSRLVELMGGIITVESTPNQGSTFSFSIPVKEGLPASVESNADASVYVTNDLKILVAEDNKINQLVVLKMLKKFGYQADIAENGLEAVAMAEQGSYDLIFMDMQMPEMDGIEATKGIRALNLFKNPRIIGLTANAYETDRQLCLEAGMDDFLTKPIQREALQKVIFII